MMKNKRFKCGNCGNLCELDEPVADGQRILCPFCGQRTIYSIPKRISLPEGAERMPRRAVAGQPQSPTMFPQSPAQPSQPPPAPKKKLGIIRDATAARKKDADLNAAAIQRRMADDEQVRAMEMQAAAKAKRAAFRDAVKRNVAILVVLVIAAGAGVTMLARYTAAKAQKARIAQHQAEMRDRQMAEAKKVEEEYRRAEAERREKEELLNRQERQRKRDEVERKRQEAVAIEEAKRNEMESRDAIFASFSRQCVLPWSALSHSNRPGGLVGTFVCVLPSSEGQIDFYEVVSTTNGYAVSLCQRRGIREPVDRSAFERRVVVSGALTKLYDLVYFMPAKSSADGVLLNDCRNMYGEDLATHCFGAALYQFIRQHALDLRDLAFELSFSGCAAAEKLPKQRIRYGETFDARRMMDQIVEVERARVRVKKPKPIRQTVKWYDGRMVQRRMNVTLVPRNPSNADRCYAQMASEADRQEEMLREQEREYAAQVKAAGDVVEEKVRSTVVMKVRLVK